MSAKRSPVPLSIAKAKRRKTVELSYFQKTLQECGLALKKPPEKCEATQDIVYIIRDLKKSLSQHEDHPHNIENFLNEFKTECDDKKTFEHYLFLNVVRKTHDKNYNVDDSVIKILLNVPFLQTKLVSYIFDKAMDALNETHCGPWVKMILKSFSNLDTVESSEELSTKLIDLLDVSSDKFVRLEIISAIPDIIGDCEHDNVASEMSRILSSDSYLIPSILDCLTYLCLSDSQFEQLQNETLKLMQPSNAAYFSNFVKFLLTPGRLTDSSYENTIKGLRKDLGWSTMIGSEEDIATSQILTAKEIRNSMLSSQTVAKIWLKVVSSCTSHTEHKPIDIIFFVIIASISDEKQKQVENIVRKQIRQQILKEELLDKAFMMFKPILKKNIKILISLANSLLKPGAEPSVEAFGAYMHMLMFSQLTECRPIIVNELVHLVRNCKTSALNTLNILNKIAAENLTVMMKQSNQILILLDRLDDMELAEVKAVMNLVCRLAYSSKYSDIRNELHIIIRKELGSSIPSIKTQGVLAGVHAVKYLMKDKVKDVSIQEDVTLNMTTCLPDGDLREAAQMIELIHHSTAQFPDMTTFFYDELYKIIQRADDINQSFLVWLTYAFTNYWQENFLIDAIGREKFGDIKVSMQLRLNLDSEVDEDWAVNIAGLILEDGNHIIEVMSSLFQLVRILHYKKGKGDLSDIDALLGCPIVMPIVDVDSINDLNESTVKEILDCYTICVNWIRELLNAFVSQDDQVLKPKILSRIAQLRDLERTIDKLRFKKTEQNDTTIAGSTKSQETQMTQITKPIANHNIQFRPLDLTLINIVKYDLTPLNAGENELTFETLTYLLSYINVSLEKVLVPRIKKKTFLSKDVEVYTYSEAETQAEAVSKVLPKVMDHVELVISFLECHGIEDENLNIDTVNMLNIMESLLCLEHIYNLLAIYFRWNEFKNRNLPLLKSSLQTVAKVNDDVSLEDLVTAVAKTFQKHEKYIITISSAASLIQVMKALQDLSAAPEIPTILKKMAHTFLSKQWKTSNAQLEKGQFYNQCLDSLTKVYLGNNKIEELKNVATSVVEGVQDMRDKNSILTTLKSINKGNFYILFRNMGATVFDKIKSYIDGGFTNEEHVEMWRTVANILKLMSDMVTTLNNKLASAHFLKISIPIFKILHSKGFPILNIEFKNHRQVILDLLKDFLVSTECLQNICAQSNNGNLMNKIPTMEELLTGFIYKTKDLWNENDCPEALKMVNVRVAPEPGRKSKKNKQKTVYDDVTVEDLDDYLQSDEEINNLDSVGVSDMI